MHTFIQSLIQIIDWTFGATVLVLTLWLIASKAIRNLTRRYLDRRQAHFESLLHESMRGNAEVWNVLSLEHWGDRQVLWRIFAYVSENFSGQMTLRLSERLKAMGFLADALKRLQSHWWWVRAEAAYQLGLLKDTSAVPALIRSLRDKSEVVGLAASRALTRIQGCDAFPPILARYAAQWGSPSLDVASVLFEMGPEASPYLVKSLPTLSRSSQLLAIDILGYFKDPLSVSPLLQMISSTDFEVRARVVKALGQIGHPSALSAVALAATDEHPTVRLLACGALSHWINKESIEALSKCLEDPQFNVRLRAAEALSHMGTAGNKALKVARRHASPATFQIVDKYLHMTGSAA